MSSRRKKAPPQRITSSEAESLSWTISGADISNAVEEHSAVAAEAPVSVASSEVASSEGRQETNSSANGVNENPKGGRKKRRSEAFEEELERELMSDLIGGPSSQSTRRATSNTATPGGRLIIVD